MRSHASRASWLFFTTALDVLYTQAAAGTQVRYLNSLVLKELENSLVLKELEN